MSTRTELAEQRFGRDIVLPPPEGPVLVTPTGDWPTIAGKLNLHGAMIRRAVVAKGELVHRPKYGGDVPRFVSVASNLSERARLSASVRENALRDPRVADARIQVDVLPGDRTQLTFTIQARGDVEADQLVVHRE